MAGLISRVAILERRPLGITVRQWRAVRHASMMAAGLYWHQNMLPEHFTAKAKFVYHYKRRTKKHEQRKERAARRGRSGTRLVDRRAGTDSLTFSGTLRDNVLRVAHIRSFEQRFKLIMPGTNYTPEKPRRPNQPPIAAEVTKLLAREGVILARVARETARENIKAARAGRTITSPS